MAGYRKWGNGHYSSEYRDVLGSDRWQRVRSRAMLRARWRCERCGSGGSLDGHHANGYSNLGRESPGEIQMLCRVCHDRAHGRMSREDFIYQTWLNKQMPVATTPQVKSLPVAWVIVLSVLVSLGVLLVRIAQG